MRAMLERSVTSHGSPIAGPQLLIPAGHSDAFTISGDDLLSSLICSSLVHVSTYDVRTLFCQALRRRFADAGARTKDGHDLPRQFFFRRQPAQFGLLQRPVLDIEGFC